MSAQLRLVQPAAELPKPDTASLPEQLRQIAHDAESGLMAGAQSAVVIVNRPGSELTVYGIGPGDHSMRLEAAYMLLALAKRELERIASEIRA